MRGSAFLTKTDRKRHTQEEGAVPFRRFIGKTAAPPDARSKRRESPVVAHRASHCVGSSTMSKKLPLLQEAGYVVSAFLRKEILALLRKNAAGLPSSCPLPVLRDLPSVGASFPFPGRNPTPAPSPFRPPYSFLRCLTAGSLRHYFSQVDALQTFSLGVLRFRAPDRTCPGFRVSWAPPPTAGPRLTGSACAVPAFPLGPPSNPRRSARSSLIPRPAEAKHQSIVHDLSNK